MENVFKVGDLIRGKKDNSYGITNEKMTKGVVVGLENKRKDMRVKILEHESGGFKKEIFEVKNSNKEFELIKTQMKKDELKNCDIVTLRNGDKLIYIDECFYDLDTNNSNSVGAFESLKDDLTYWDGAREYDVVKVERPIEYATAYNRKKITKEMTISEISKALGYNVKIVKEK